MLWFRTARSKATGVGLLSPTKYTCHGNGLPDLLSAHWAASLQTDRSYSNTTTTEKSTLRRRWTSQEEQALVELRKSGVTFSQIKFHLPGRTTYAVISRFNSLARGNGPLAEQARELMKTKAKIVPVSREDVRKAMRLSAKGLSSEEISAKIGKGHGSRGIRRLLRDPDHHLNPRRRQRFTPEQDLLLTQLAQDGLRWSEIRKKFPSKSLTALQTRWHLVLQTKAISSESMDTTKGRPIWSHQTMEKLLDMYKQGKTTQAIAKELGCKDKQVRWKLNRLGIVQHGSGQFDATGAQDVLNSLELRKARALRRVTWEEGAKMREMARSGMSVQQIARALLESTAVVKYWVAKDDRPGPRPHAWTRQEEARLVELLASGKDSSTVAEELGRTKLAVHSKMFKVRHPGVRDRDSAAVPYKTHWWTAEEETRLTELLAGKKTAAAIAEELGRTKPAVCGKIRKFRREGSLSYRHGNTKQSAKSGDVEAN